MNATLTYTTGERKAWRVVPRTAGGGAADLAGAQAELRVSYGVGCLVVAAARDEQGFLFSLSPETIPLPPGRYSAGLWITWAARAALKYGRWVLIVEKGC